MKGKKSKLILSILATCLLSGCSHHEYDWCAIREENLVNDLETIYSEVELPKRPLVLCDILQVAFERNLDLMVKAREEAIQEEVATRETLKMLPSLTVDGDDNGRNKPVLTTALTSTGQITNGFTTRESRNRLYNITAAYNLLDFGLSFYRSRQEQNRIMSTCLEYQRTRQNLILDIVNEYWKGIVAKRVSDLTAKGFKFFELTL